MKEKFKLLFTQEELAILDAALSAMPYNQVAALIFNINKQIEDAFNQANNNPDERP